METRARDPFYNIGPWAFLAYCLAKLIWLFPAALIFRQLGRVKGRETFPMDGPVLLLANHTAALDLEHWLFCIAAASMVLWVEEIRKLITRGTHHEDSAE